MGGSIPYIQLGEPPADGTNIGWAMAFGGTVEAVRATPASSLATTVERWAAPAVALLTVGLLAARQGGYFPTTWGWAAVLTLWAVGLWLVVGVRSEVGRLEAAFVAAFGAVGAWTALSILWSEAPATSVLELERAVLYVSALAAVLLLARREAIHLLAGAIFTAILLVACYSLSTRIFPDRLGVFDSISGYRLSEPIGYWNGLGIFLAIGVLLAVGFAARGRSIAVRLIAAGSLAILMPAIYFTFSRGAWIALGIGCLCALALDARRVQLASMLLLLAPVPAVATLLASRSHALTHTKVPLADAVHDGHRLALAVALLVPGTALCALVGIILERRLHPRRSIRLAYVAMLLVLPVVALVILFARYGSPAHVASRAYNSFKSPPAEGANLNKRLLSLTSNGRIDLWHVAWADYKQHSALGSGAGTYARHWFEERPGHRSTTFNARDAHGAYIETLAELGPVGLLLLVAGLAVPLAAAIRARREPLAAFLLAAYVAFVLHAGVDWDFELPAVGLAGLFCGAALLVAARGDTTPWEWRGLLRGGALAAAVALTGFALFGLIGNSALASSDSARDDHNWTKAESQARKARRLMPWSPDPWVALGSAQYAAGEVRSARASFRRAVAKDTGDWRLWFDLAAVTTGKERKAALERARRLNPLSAEIADLGLQLPRRKSGP